MSTISQAISQSTPSTPQSVNVATACALSSVIQSQSHSSWNADTGASAHMTSNCHCMCHMTPYCIPVRLADGSVLYSEGIGSVRFIPEVNGCQMAPLEFSNVLRNTSHLYSLIFSLSYISQFIVISLSQLSWTPFISSEMARLSFKRRPLYQMLHILLETNTIPVEELASLSSTATLPMDLTLLHCHLCHHHLAGIRKLLLGNLVTGLKLDSKAEPDPVCEACKAGKIHADPFPTLSTRASRPLQLVHSDVHGPVKVSTH